MTQLASQVSLSVAPVLERARQLSHEALTVDRTSRPSATDGAAPTPSAAVRNTFNVNVQLDSANTASGMDRRTLEDTLVDILRETARRHGLEV